MKWVIGAVVLFLLAVIFKLSLLMYATYALLAIYIFTRWLTANWTNNLGSKSTISIQEAEIGDVVTIEHELTNRGRLPVSWVLVEDELPPDTQLFRPHRLEVVEGERIHVFGLGVGETEKFTYKIKCNRRGYYQLGPLLVESGDTFGLHRRFRTVAEPNFLLVYPKPVVIENYDIATRRPIGEIRMTHRLFEDPTRIAGVRAYQQGDPLNRVHWKATSRTGVLHSKVYEPSTIAGATIVLDFHKESYPAKHEPYRSELAVVAAASLAHTLYEMGQQIGLVSNGRDAVDRIRTEGWRRSSRSRTKIKKNSQMQEKSERLRPIIVGTRIGVDQYNQILRSLARVEITDGMPLPELLIETTPHIPHDAAVIVIVSEVTERIAVSLGNLARQGYAVTAIVNAYEYEEFARGAGMLISQRVSVRHLRDESQIADMCRQQILR